LVFRLEYVAKRLNAYVDGKIQKLPEVEEERLWPNVYRNNPTEDDYVMFGWNHIVANGCI
ncbi:MAG: hypothetical protein IJB97_10250, partial [Clostridia bacterium]|nr:hypothetical protein [Clostridia bacterium]